MKHLVLSVALTFAIAGCASAPPTRYHSLLSTAEPVTQDAGLPPMPIDLAPVSVPVSVDQPQWVVRMPDDTLRILEQEQWVSPLRDELRAALSERLAQRFSAVDVRSAPATHPVRVRVDVQRFETVAGREVRLDSTWAARAEASAAPALICHSSLHEPAVGDAAALAAAHRRAVTRLADQIGSQLLALTNGAGTRCP